MKPRILPSCGFLFLLIAAPVLPVGQAALPTLMLLGDARYAALGEAGGAICFDIGAAQLNPAGLFFMERPGDFPVCLDYFFEFLLPEFGLSDLWHQNISLAGRYKNRLSVAIANKHVSFGENEWRDEIGRYLGSFYSYDNFTIISLASNLEQLDSGSHYSIGVNIKFLYSNLADVPIGNSQRRGIADDFAIDAGYLYREPFLNIFSAGITLQNMGPDITYIDYNQRDPLPFNLKLALGAAFRLENLLTATLALDLNKELVRRGDDDETIRKYGRAKPHDPFWKAFFTAWQDDPWEEEAAGIIRSYGLELLALNTFALRWGRMIDKAGCRWESTCGCGIKTRFIYFSFATIDYLEHAHYKYDWSYDDDTTARKSQTRFTWGIKYPL